MIKITKIFLCFFIVTIFVLPPLLHSMQENDNKITLDATVWGNLDYELRSSIFAQTIPYLMEELMPQNKSNHIDRDTIQKRRPQIGTLLSFILRYLTRNDTITALQYIVYPIQDWLPKSSSFAINLYIKNLNTYYTAHKKDYALTKKDLCMPYSISCWWKSINTYKSMSKESKKFTCTATHVTSIHDFDNIKQFFYPYSLTEIEFLNGNFTEIPSRAFANLHLKNLTICSALLKRVALDAFENSTIKYTLGFGSRYLSEIPPVELAAAIQKTLSISVVYFYSHPRQNEKNFLDYVSNIKQFLPNQIVTYQIKK